MKPLYLALLLLICKNSFSQICENAGFLCTENVIPVGNITNFPLQNTGIDFGCLDEPMNVEWMFIKPQGSIFSMSLSQTTTGGFPINVDFVLWGPFDVPTCNPQDLNGHILSCSDLFSNPELITIENPIPGKYYLLAVANSSNQSGQYTITQLQGSTDCSNSCDLTISSGNGPCEIILTASIPSNSYIWSSSVTGLLNESSETLHVTTSAIYTATLSAPACAGNGLSTLINVEFPVVQLGQPDDLVACSSAPGIFDLTVTTDEILGGLNPEEYEVMFFVTQEDAQTFSNPISDPTAFSATGSTTVFFGVQDFELGCIKTGSFNVVFYDDQEFSLEIDGQQVTVTPALNGNTYAMNGGFPQVSNIFTNVPLGENTIEVISSCGSSVLNFMIVVPSAPTGAGIQYFDPGETLANLDVVGETIVWYDQQSNGTELPSNTPLVNANTYFAAQRINGIESTNRLAVQAFDVTLTTNASVIQNVKVYPNPTTGILIIENQSLVDSVAISDSLGKILLNKELRASFATIDISHLASGVYIMEIRVGAAEKFVKLIKN